VIVIKKSLKNVVDFLKANPNDGLGSRIYKINKINFNDPSLVLHGGAFLFGTEKAKDVVKSIYEPNASKQLGNTYTYRFGESSYG